RQKNPAQGRNDSIKTLVNLNGGYDLNSNSINNNFIRFFRNNYITDQNKSDNEKRLKAVNRAGLEMNAGLTWMQKGKKLTYVVGLNERRMATAKFSKDFFELLFRGNGAYVGKSAQLSPLKITYFNYESLYLGVQKNIEEKKLMIGGGISLIRGGTFDQVKIKKGTLYTDTALAYIDFNMNYQLAYPNNQGSAFGSTNGLGLAGTFYMSWIREKGQLNFEIRDLGFIRYKNLNVYSGNSTYRYNGYNVNNILQLNDSIFTNLKADSIAKSMGLQKEKKNITYMIPATFHLNYVYHYNDRLTLVGGVKHIINASYLPRVYIKSVYYLKKDLVIIPMLAYGGFGRADFEFGISKSFHDKLMVSANLFYLEYFLMAKKSSGNGLSLSVSKLF
ncbi:MAG TPA: hypothetical protein VNW99_13795, partial [Cytophagaceae bacterium]|nr:hypothetical protein [Cytophagaceae bacterium]